jgi:hypothetical protein
MAKVYVSSTEALARRDPANTEWQTDVAVLCAKLGTLVHAQHTDMRCDYLLHGRGILVELKAAGHLLPNQDWIEWFDSQLSQMPPDRS